MAGFSDDDIQQVREKVNIVDVIGERVRLKKTGRTFKGLCPFHNEKTPSFHVDAAKQLYHCFGCGTGGDVFSFLMAAEGYDFSEAVEILARRIGYTLSPQSPRQAGKKTRLLKACEEAAVFYEKSLREGPGATARNYIKHRGLTGLATEFRLGYSPDWSSVLKYLRSRGVGERDFMEAGIAAKSEKGTLYDRLKGRLIFPILDNQGRPVAFGGRVLDGTTPKYLNSPETPLYHKGSILYGLSQAKNAFLKTNTAIVVEGYTDLLALIGAEVRNVVATLGTAFTEDHLRLLGRFIDRIVLVFDGDEAGLSAAERTSEYIYMQGLLENRNLKGLLDNNETEILAVALPKGLDPADFVTKHGVAAFSTLVAGARPLGLFLIDRIIARHGGGQSGKTKVAVAAAERLLGKLTSPVAKQEYSRYLAEKLDISDYALAEEVRRVVSGAQKHSKGVPVAERRVSGPERELIKLLLKWPEKASVLEDVEAESWPDAQLRRLSAVLKDLALGKGEKINDIIHQIDPELRSLASELALENDEGLSEDVFTEIYLKCKESALDRRIGKLKKELERTNSSEMKYNDLFEELVALEYKRRELRNHVMDGGSLWVTN